MAEARHRILTGQLMALALLLGSLLAVVNVPAVAFFSFLLGGESTLRFGVEVDTGLYYRVNREDSLGGTWWGIESTDVFRADDLASMLAEGVVHPIDELGVPAPWPKESMRRNTSWGYVLIGWPMRAAAAHCDPKPESVPIHQWRDAVYVGSTLIPLQPLWPGLLANTFFYATFALTPMVLLRWRRARRRRARGKCVACGCELGEDVAVCPECGLEAS